MHKQPVLLKDYTSSTKRKSCYIKYPITLKDGKSKDRLVRAQCSYISVVRAGAVFTRRADNVSEKARSADAFRYVVARCAAREWYGRESHRLGHGNK